MDTIPQDTPQDKPTPKTTFIYVLIDPRDNAVRYVGKTNELQERFYRHIYDASRAESHTHKDRWLRNLLDLDLKPIMEVIEEVSYEQWELRECYWIDFYRAQGCLLTNTAKGGRGGQGLTPDEVRAKISAAKRGTKYRLMSEEGRRNMGIAHKGKRHTPEAKAKIADAHRGKKASPETLAKLSASHIGQPPTMKGRTHTPEARAKMSAARTGRKFGPMAEETKRKISEAQIGKKVSDKTRARLSASHKGQIPAMKGRKHSPESRAKMSSTKKRINVMKKNPPELD